MDNNLLKQMAKSEGISESEVRKELEMAIWAMYSNPNLTQEQRKKQGEVPRKGAIPTVEEFVDYISKLVNEI